MSGTTTPKMMLTAWGRTEHWRTRDLCRVLTIFSCRAATFPTSSHLMFNPRRFSPSLPPLAFSLTLGALGDDVTSTPPRIPHWIRWDIRQQNGRHPNRFHHQLVVVVLVSTYSYYNYYWVCLRKFQLF